MTSKNQTSYVSDPDVPAHAVLSPSASERWIACPGSVAAAASCPQRPAGKHALLGTAAHSLLELCLRLDQDAEKFIGLEIEENHVVDDDMANAVQHGVDFVREEMKANPKLRLHCEVRVKIGPLIGLHNGELEGTSDIILEDGRMCIVADYKHGQGVYVDARKNSQLRLYAAGARHRNEKPFFKYRSVVIQPRVYANNGNAIRDDHFTENELVSWLLETVRPSAHAALTPGAKRVAGKHCHWCPASGKCKEQARYVASLAASEFGPIDLINELL